MATEDDKDLENYKAILRRQEMHWRAQYDFMLNSDRFAVDIGLTALRISLLVNAGAVVALLAFVGQLWDKEPERMADVLSASVPFVWGLISAAVAAGVAYFYQSGVTAKSHHELEKISRASEDIEPQVWIPRLTNLTRLGMLALVMAAYGFFLWGTLRAIDTLAPGVGA